MAMPSISKTTVPPHTIQPLSIDFEAKAEEAAKVFVNHQEIHNYALQALGAIHKLVSEIMVQIEQYNSGNIHYRDAIVTKIDQIATNIIHPRCFPQIVDGGQRQALEAFFTPIHQECQRLRCRLFPEVAEAKETKSFKETQNHQLGVILSQEQGAFSKSASVFPAFLERLNLEVAKKNTIPTVYFAYSSPTEGRLQQESWVFPFLQNLQHHLKAAGIHTVYLDGVSNRYGAHAYGELQKAESSDYVVLFGTESLKEMHDKGVSSVCTQLIHILRKRRKDLTEGENLSRVFPILLSGSLEESFPPEYERYSTAVDWRQKGYLYNFQCLYLELFHLAPEKYLGLIQGLWGEVSKGCPPESAQIEETMKMCAAQRAYLNSGQLLEVQSAPPEEPVTPLIPQLASLQIGSQGVPVPSFAFGKQKWETYCGVIGEEPPLPENMNEILNRPCPYWKKRLIKDTHLLVLIPKTVNGVPLTLNYLKHLVRAPQNSGYPIPHFLEDEEVLKALGADRVVEAPYWMLMTKRTIPRTHNIPYPNQLRYVQAPYTVPSVLEAVVGITTHYIGGGGFLFEDDEDGGIHTHCQELLDEGKSCVGVGGFSAQGIYVSPHIGYRDNDPSYGVGAVIRISESKTPKGGYDER